MRRIWLSSAIRARSSWVCPFRQPASKRPGSGTARRARELVRRRGGWFRRPRRRTSSSRSWSVMRMASGCLGSPMLGLRIAFRKMRATARWLSSGSRTAWPTSRWSGQFHLDDDVGAVGFGAVLNEEGSWNTATDPFMDRPRLPAGDMRWCVSSRCHAVRQGTPIRLVRPPGMTLRQRPGSRSRPSRSAKSAGPVVPPGNSCSEGSSRR